MPDPFTTSETRIEQEQRLSNIYTPLNEAVAELRSSRRRALRKSLAGLLPPSPHFDKDDGIAFQSRQLATPNLEISFIRNLALSVNLDLGFFEYHADKFVSRNPCKLALGRLGFCSGHDRHNELMISYHNVISFSQDGRPIRDVKTLWNQPLVEFHHELLKLEWPETSADAWWDASDWYHQRESPQAYWIDFFSLCIAHGILFEVFLLDSVEEQFTSGTVLPAFYEVWKRFGLKPLVVRTVPLESEANYRYWLTYSSKAKQYVESKIGFTGRHCPSRQHE